MNLKNYGLRLKINHDQKPFNLNDLQFVSDAQLIQVWIHGKHYLTFPASIAKTKTNLSHQLVQYANFHLGHMRTQFQITKEGKIIKNEY